VHSLLLKVLNSEAQYFLGGFHYLPHQVLHFRICHSMRHWHLGPETTCQRARGGKILKCTFWGDKFYTHVLQWNKRELLAYLISHFTTSHSVAEFRSLASALYLNDMDRHKWWDISYEFYINSILMWEVPQ
jgi:hypothetical protein